MKRTGAILLFIFMLPIVAAGASPVYAPLKPAFETLTAGEKPLPADFVKYGTKIWFNDRMVKAAENIFTWAKDGRCAPCLMILIDTRKDGAANKSLYVPEYGLPDIGKTGAVINITWKNPGDSNDVIALAFQIGGREMRVHENPVKGTKESRKTGLPVGAYDSDGQSALYYVPLYAILNEVGGGVMFDPFGEGSAFIYTGGALRGYSGVWEVSDDSEYRVDVNMGGKTVSVANYWWSLELRPDGTFTETDRHYKDEGGWFLTEFKGRYAFFGRILALKFTSQSLHFGDDFHNLHPYQADVPFEEKWGVTDDVYAEYVDDWSAPGVLYIRGSRPLYSKELSGRKW